jgi:lysophospholipase L1-like esterase
MKFFRLIVAIVLLLCCAACSKQPALSQLPAEATILAFGDSLTFGTGAGEAQSYPAVLAVVTGRKVVNAGVPGEISAEGLARLPEVLEREKPALLILCHGGNDILRRLDQGVLADNLRAMVRLARGKGVEVVLLAVPAFGLGLKPLPLYEEVAKELNVPLERKSLAQILTKNALKSDYIHPNAAGYRQLAAAVDTLLRKSGAVPK